LLPRQKFFNLTLAGQYLFGVVELSEKHWYTYPAGILLDFGLRRYVNHPGLAQIWVGLG
jgi:hypothetical protein